MARTLPATPHILISALVLAFSLPAHAQLVINQNLTPRNMVQNILMGQDVVISHVAYNGDTNNVVAPVATTSLGEIGTFNGFNTVLGFNGVFLCAGSAQTILPGPNDELMQFVGSLGGAGFFTSPDMDLSHLTGWPNWIYGGNNIGNKSILEFDFVPFNDMVSFNYVFSSEEYERWACSQYNDAFGLFISGPGIPTNINGPFINNAMNIAFIPGSLAPVTINSLNSGRINAGNANGPLGDPFQYCNTANPNWQADSIYYRYNGGQWNMPQPPGSTAQLEAPYNTDPYYIQHNGLTVKLTASAAVQIGETYHIKVGIANTADNRFSSAAWIEGGTFAALDRFTLTVDAGYNVDLSDTVPVLYQNSTDSVFLRFNRWGGFYLDEYLQLAVGGDAVAGVDYLPSIPDSLHFNQLDSAVVLPLVLPVHATETRDLIINLITSEGNKVADYHFILAGENTTGVRPIASRAEDLVVFPNPANQALHVSLPYGMKGPAEVQVLDMTGRVVLRQALNAPSGTLNLEQLPNGLYTVKVEADGQVATARVSVKH